MERGSSLAEKRVFTNPECAQENSYTSGCRLNNLCRSVPEFGTGFVLLMMCWMEMKGPSLENSSLLQQSRTVTSCGICRIILRPHDVISPSCTFRRRRESTVWLDWDPLHKCLKQSRDRPSPVVWTVDPNTMEKWNKASKLGSKKGGIYVWKPLFLCLCNALMERWWCRPATNDSVNQYLGWCVTAVLLHPVGAVTPTSPPQTQQRPHASAPAPTPYLWLCQWSLQTEHHSEGKKYIIKPTYGKPY